jgi:hypothetical protein
VRGAATMRVLPSVARLYRPWLWPRASSSKRAQVRHYARVGAQRPLYSPRYIPRRAASHRCAPLHPATSRYAPLRPATRRYTPSRPDVLRRSVTPDRFRDGPTRRTTPRYALTHPLPFDAPRGAPPSPDAPDAPRCARRPRARRYAPLRPRLSDGHICMSSLVSASRWAFFSVARMSC